jgi:hypothetical protein
MTPLNTLPIEDFLNKARVAIKSNQRSITLDLKETTDLANSLSIVMTRLSGELDKVIQNAGTPSPTEIKMDGGGF